MNKNITPVIQIDDVLVSTACITEKFCCDLDACKGACCIEGDAGAPVTVDEVVELVDALPTVWNDMSPKAQKVIEAQGVSYADYDGELVTSIVKGKDCVFTYYDKKGCCLCLLEKSYNQGSSNFRKPLSCYLYPIRMSQVGDCKALNYHHWSVCKDAVAKGERENIAVYQFLRGPLIRAFGEAWYAELEKVVEEMKAEGMI